MKLLTKAQMRNEVKILEDKLQYVFDQNDRITILSYREAEALMECIEKLGDLRDALTLSTN